MDSLTSATSIPLDCNICPRQPHFSDISHLLTHISSKAHLSHEYKVKVRGNYDPVAKATLDQYYAWYERYGLGALMHERLQQKDRKSRVSKKGAASSGSNQATTTPNATNATNFARRGSMTLRESVLDQSQFRRDSMMDPEFGTPVKQEPVSRPGTPVPDFYGGMSSFGNKYIPLMAQSWTASPLTDVSTTQASEQTDSPGDENWEPDGSAQRRKTNRSARCQQQKESPQSENSGDEEKEDYTKLKGVCWPGIALFDSATLDMRRKRNQKKATSVVKSLQDASENIEAEELVFDDSFSHKVTRTITGDPEIEGSPLPGESSPEPAELPPAKKPRRGRAKQPLAGKDTNTGRTLRSRRVPSSAQSRSQYLDESEEDEELTYDLAAPDHRPRHSLSIHKDNSGPDITFHRSNSSTDNFNDLVNNGLFPNYLQHADQSRTLRMHSTAPMSSFDGATFGHGMSHSQPAMGYYDNDGLDHAPTHLSSSLSFNGLRPSAYGDPFSTQDYSTFGQLTNNFGPTTLVPPNPQQPINNIFHEFQSQTYKYKPRRPEQVQQIPGRPLSEINTQHAHNDSNQPGLLIGRQVLDRFDVFSADFGVDGVAIATDLENFDLAAPIDLTGSQDELFVGSNKTGVDANAGTHDKNDNDGIDDEDDDETVSAHESQRSDC